MSQDFSPSFQAQRKELFIQERYGKYNVSDPFLALQRDTEAVGGQNKEQGCSSATSNPLVVLKLVVSHCRRMQEKMLSQLAAAESRHRRVGVDPRLSISAGRIHLLPHAHLKPALVKQQILMITAGALGWARVMRRKQERICAFQVWKRCTSVKKCSTQTFGLSRDPNEEVNAVRIPTENLPSCLILNHHSQFSRHMT